MLQYNIDLNGKTILVTGAAGFIGSNLVKRLLNDFEEISIIGVDNLTDYYDVRLKQERLRELGVEKAANEYVSIEGSRFRFIQGNISDKVLVDLIFDTYHPQIVVNLAA